MFFTNPTHASLDALFSDLISHVLEEGQWTENRTDTDTKKVFSVRYSFPVAFDSFPILKSKKVFWKSVATELVWMLKGETNVKWLNERGVHIWDAWADKRGDLGPVYGKQWRYFGGDGSTDTPSIGVDQLIDVIRQIQENPNSRRHLVSAWNPVDLPDMALPPCHYAYQFNVRGSTLDLQVQQRSQDLFIGAPFNWSAYALLLCIVSKLTDLEPGFVAFSVGDLHLYENHIEYAEPFRKGVSEVPSEVSLEIDLEVPGHPETFIDALQPDDLQISGYDPGPHIEAPVAV